MTAALQRLVRERAGNRCEYCGVTQEDAKFPLQMEHIIPKKHGGLTTDDNLALACAHCNLHKGPNLTGFDPDSAEVCRLFHPRQDVWSEHFRMASALIHGITSCGRTTIWVLEMNSEVQVMLREDL